MTISASRAAAITSSTEEGSARTIPASNRSGESNSEACMVGGPDASGAPAPCHGRPIKVTQNRSGVREGLSRRAGARFQQTAQLHQRLRLELTDTLLGQAEFLTETFQRSWIVTQLALD